MVGPSTIAAVGLQALTAGIAAFGAWRCVRLQQYGSDRRLKMLGWFFGLFAASVALHAVWEWQIGELFEDQLPPPGSDAFYRDNATAGPNGTFDRPARGTVVFFRGFFEPEGSERITPWLFGHHVLMIASLAVAVAAYARRRPADAPLAAAFSPLLLMSDLTILLLALQSALTLYLAIRALLNHIERRSPGALQVAIGFLLFFLGHLLYFLAHRPGEGREGIGDVLALVGIVFLVQVLPGKQ